MKLISFDDAGATIRFTKLELSNLKAATGYVASFFATIDREALDGSSMTMKDAEELADDLANLSTPKLTGGL